MILKSGQRCPIHKSRFCACHGERKSEKKASKYEQVRVGVRRIKDPHSDWGDGYRYLYSESVKRQTVIQKVEEQSGLCAYCHDPLTNMSDVEGDHRLPRGSGGGRRDDRFLQAVHSRCNSEKGSRRSPHEHRTIQADSAPSATR